MAIEGNGAFPKRSSVGSTSGGRKSVEHGESCIIGGSEIHNIGKKSGRYATVFSLAHKDAMKGRPIRPNRAVCDNEILPIRLSSLSREPTPRDSMSLIM